MCRSLSIASVPFFGTEMSKKLTWTRQSKHTCFFDPISLLLCQQEVEGKGLEKTCHDEATGPGLKEWVVALLFLFLFPTRCSRSVSAQHEFGEQDVSGSSGNSDYLPSACSVHREQTDKYHLMGNPRE